MNEPLIVWVSIIVLMVVENTFWCQNGNLSRNQWEKRSSITTVAWMESEYIQ